MKKLQVQDFVVLAGANAGLAIVSGVFYVVTTHLVQKAMTKFDNRKKKKIQTA